MIPHIHTPYMTINAARSKAYLKHNPSGNSMERWPANAPAWPVILGEEFGEVCRAFHEAATAGLVDSRSTDLYNELVDVMAITSAWMQAISEDR